MNIDIEKIKSANQDLNETLAFKVSSHFKKDFIDFCLKHKLSVSRILRISIEQTIEELKKELGE